MEQQLNCSPCIPYQMAWFIFQLFHLPFRFLLLHILEGCRWWLKYLGVFCSCQRSKLRIRLLVWARHSPGQILTFRDGHFRSESAMKDLCVSLSVPLPLKLNKINVLYKYAYLLKLIDWIFFLKQNMHSKRYVKIMWSILFLHLGFSVK